MLTSERVENDSEDVGHGFISQMIAEPIPNVTADGTISDSVQAGRLDAEPLQASTNAAEAASAATSVAGGSGPAT